MTPDILIPGQVTLQQLERIFRQHLPVRLHDSARPGILSAAAHIAAAAKGSAAVYGVNTGFGKLASVKIASEDTETLQKNLILSHCCGVGDPMPQDVTRLMMVLKLLSLGRGASGVRLAVVDILQDMLAKGVIPVIPDQGSVGASGDLAPLAHMAAVMIGHGQAMVDGEVKTGAEALASRGISPITLGAKEGLALINGTQFSTAYALAGLFQGWRAANEALVISAMSTDAIMGSTAPLEAEIHALRGHPGQIEAAAAMRALLAGSAIRESHREDDHRVQDPYCIRCQPQVTGAAMDVLRMAARTLQIEANAATDNPLVLSGGQIVSGGNFHAEPVGFAADMIALALAEIGAISERRIAMLTDPALNSGLPAFLVADSGINSGFMLAHVTAAALVAENRALATPRSVDSLPTSANQEDHVSMATAAALRLHDMAENLATILGIEILAAAQGIGFHRPLTSSVPIEAAIATLREQVPPWIEDRFMAPDIEAAKRLVEQGAFAALVDLPA